jgi:hypothetical protein
VLLCLIGAPASAQTPDAQLIAPIKRFIDSFNKGDVAGVAATHAVEAGSRDPGRGAAVPVAKGPGVKDWSTDLEADAKERGITEPTVTISAPTRIEATADQAYVVVPAVYSFKERDVTMRGKRRGDVRPEEGRLGLTDSRVDVDRPETSESERLNSSAGSRERC